MAKNGKESSSRTSSGPETVASNILLFFKDTVTLKFLCWRGEIRDVDGVWFYGTFGQNG